jgi:lysozyme
MNTDLLKEMLRRHEGLRLKPYKCSAGAWTIGYGWNIKANPLPSDVASMLNLTGQITKPVAERLLNISIESATRQAWDIFPGFGGFSENRQAALVDWIFNIGAGKALTFKKAMAAINMGEWGTAADELYLSEWREQVGDRAAEIIGMVRKG